MATRRARFSSVRGVLSSTALPALVRLPALLALALLATELTCAPAAAGTKPPRSVLTIHSGAVEYPGNPVLDGAIRDILSRSGEPIDYFSEYLEFDGFADPQASLALGDYINRKYAGRRIDLVIATTGLAAQFVLENRHRLFRSASVVFAGLGVAADDLVRGAGPGVTGVRIGSNFAETMKLALQLHPGTRQVFVVAKTRNPINAESVRAELRPFASRVKLTYLEAATLNDLLTAIKAIPRGSLILYVWYQRPGTESLVDPSEPARLVTEVAKVPVYGVSDTTIGTGVVGGMLRQTRATGMRAGEMAVQILKGTPADNVPMEYTPLVPIFDWRQLRRWGIDASRLPAQSEIRFKTPTAWETYRWYILGATLVISAQLLLIAGLLTHRRRRQSAEETLRARETTLRTSYVRIRQLAARLINAQEAARADIARDLHDDVCQELVGVSIAMDTLKRATGRMQDPQIQEELGKVRYWMLDIIDGVRRLSHDLHPSNLRLLGLATSLRAHCVEVEKRHDVQVEFRSEGEFRGLAQDVAVALFRIAQEALRNGAVHGDARRLTVLLLQTASQIEMTITDDGQGFDLEAAHRDNGGLGLISIEERAHAVGGTVQILTRIREGTVICVRVPATNRPATTPDDAHTERKDVDVHVRLAEEQPAETIAEPS